MRPIPLFVAGLTLLGGTSALGNPTSYGSGCPGSNALTPAFSLTGSPTPGGNLSMSLTQGIPSSFALLFLGTGQASIPAGFGCNLLVFPLLPAPLGPLPLDPNGDFNANFTIPGSASALTIDMQCFLADPGNPGGFSVSNGVEMVITVPTSGHLVINEVEYDTPGTDFDEFVEIYNPTASTVNLAGLSLVLVNGSNNTTYTTVDLSVGGSLGAGAYLVVANASVVPAPGTLTIGFVTASNSIQNGAPDAIALVDTVNDVLIDALSYEGSVTSAAVTGLTFSANLVEGTATTAFDDPTGTGSMCRLPDGSDSDDAATDWFFSSTPTPGAANVP